LNVVYLSLLGLAFLKSTLLIYNPVPHIVWTHLNHILPADCVEGSEGFPGLVAVNLTRRGVGPGNGHGFGWLKGQFTQHHHHHHHHHHHTSNHTKPNHIQQHRITSHNIASHHISQIIPYHTTSYHTTIITAAAAATTTTITTITTILILILFPLDPFVNKHVA
jgi:hypothetical protein